uniref:Ribosomal RNA-processing protein 14/surfeit locus protein 6 C-terminal domain-containing protein n=1 Tax=Romanomermis culicivorax TaxID=13658 RepID=A0A915L462_ROMCU
MELDWPTISAEQAFSGHLITLDVAATKIDVSKLHEQIALDSLGDLKTIDRSLAADRSQESQMIVDDSKKSRKIVQKWKKQANKKKKIVPETDGNLTAGKMSKNVTFEDAVMDLRDEKAEAKVHLALKLGAKKQKNKHLPYNQLKDERKKSKEEAKVKRLERKFDRLKKVKGGKVKKKIQRKLNK